MRNFMIVTNRTKDIDLQVTEQIQQYLLTQGADCILYDRAEEIPESFLTEKLECAIVLGGDGTILHAITPLVYHDIPILGVNMGTVGFLAGVELDDLMEALDALLSNQYYLDERTMLEGNVYREGQKIFQGVGVNDIAISRSGFSRIIRFKVWANGELVDRYGADGMVLATPTGSTGYNLSAGGPVVSPHSDVMIITPVSPHSLSSRSIVVAGSEKVMIEVEQIGKNHMEEAFVTFDGQHGTRLRGKDRIEIRRSELKTKLVKVRNTSFYEILRNKMGGRRLRKEMEDEIETTRENY